ncbi:efflux RND transporter periplasmic adaptor subunit [Bradyrhizobium sp. Arg237L]|uniref:efflux RND transporter periplasmic adaptor subunit n=1 Tax=Bradyrhizobium sp. Arg237L TaxID=3003352 RepID=UPI00249DB295|nr:efflux RND transporter periplasmic adaptor subunit [Bradyrhizobium sp. Arg237L]MDI4238287.1 efflux RND transporter periplasmic adaptor subunit [Bradyrhizobium sp. Arg237L]
MLIVSARKALREARGTGSAACVLFLLVSGCGNQSDIASKKAGSRPKAEVSVVTLHPQSIAITAELPGRTTASLTSEVRPQVNGIIKIRMFKEGGEVAAGDTLYQIDAAGYQAAFDSAVAARQKAEAAIPNAEAKVERYRTLIKQNAVSKQDLDDAVATLAQAIADVASSKAAVDTARLNLAYTSITAPIGGRIDKSLLTPGALVTGSQTTALTTIRKLDPIYVDVTESSTNLLNWRQAVREGRIKFAGADVSVKLKLENGTIYNHDGKLEFVESNVSETTGTFALRAVFPNPDRLLLPGTYVRAIIEQGIAENSFAVPQRGVTRNSKGEATGMFVTDEGKVEQRVLTVSKNVGNNWLATGIKDGDRIIVEGIQLVKPGADVKAVEVTIDNNTGEVKGIKQSEMSLSAATRVGQGDPSPAVAKD